jgi:hypothetical protein
MSERILPAIFDYHQKKYGNVIILNLGQSSSNTSYTDNIRYVKLVNEISKNFGVLVYNDKGIIDKKDIKSEKFCDNAISQISEICKKHDIHHIVLDDSRYNNFNLTLGKLCKSRDIKIYANIHGNIDKHKIETYYSLSNPFYDKLFVFGKKELKFDKHQKFLLGGIPGNDVIKDFATSQEQISIIVNRISGDKDPSEKFFDSSVFHEMKLIELQKEHNLPIVFKIKHRMSDNISKEIETLKNVISDKIKYSIVTHLDDEVEFLSKSKLVLTYGSTMAFKALQLNIPTVIFKELGTTGLFSDYAGTVNLGENYFKLIKHLDKSYFDNFLPDTLEGSTKFDATQRYSLLLKENI